MGFTKGSKTNYKIKASLIQETEKAYKLNCEGDIIWVPKSQCNFIKSLGELEISDWLFRDKFPNE